MQMLSKIGIDSILELIVLNDVFVCSVMCWLFSISWRRSHREDDDARNWWFITALVLPFTLVLLLPVTVMIMFILVEATCIFLLGLYIADITRLSWFYPLYIVIAKWFYRWFCPAREWMVDN